jgi:hypothetical protein
MLMLGCPFNILIDLFYLYSRDVLTSGLSDQMVLNESADYDSVLCSCITDIDFDGVNEILLGTYGQVSCTGSYCCNDFQLFG